MMKPAHQI